MKGEGPKVAVWRTRGAPHFLVERTRRSLRACGLSAEEINPADMASFHPDPAGDEDAWLILRAGAWFREPGRVTFPPASATALGVCAFGLTTAADSRAGDTRWREILAACGGTTVAGAANLDELELPPAIYLDGTACREIFKAGAGSALLPQILTAAARLRIIHWPGIDVRCDETLRVLQGVTSLQRGGAERLVLNLVAELAARQVRVRLAVVGRPTRDAFAAPAEIVDLTKLQRGSETAMDALVRFAASFDLLHLHLLKTKEAARLAEMAVPTIVTIHNSRPGWPHELAERKGGGARLLAACSLGVEQELSAAGLDVPVRTVWNGINFAEFKRDGSGPRDRETWRRRWGWGANDLVLLAVANPRPQKRLHLLPAVLAATRARLGPETAVRLVFAGEASPKAADALECQAQMRGEVARLRMEPHVREAGAVDDVAGLLTAADVLVSASAHEGLSLAQLEALAMNVPVVSTATAGSVEIGRCHPAVKILPLDATPERFAEAIATSVRTDGGGRAAAQRHFSAARMAERYLWLYRRAVAPRHAKPSGLWLVTNNFSMGGAQTSARRLLTALAADGVKVRAAVVQEEIERPTPGRLALQSAGVPVRAFGPHGSREAEAISRCILDAMDDDPPESVLFWNLIPIHKILLADGLFGPRVFDVSPGEMYYQALQDYFTNPRPGLPYLEPGHYGRRLAGVIVKYQAEAAQAALLGAPVHVIPNGVPLIGEMGGNLSEARMVNGSHRADTGGVLRLGTAARLSPQKRLEDLLAALHLARPRLPPFEMRIAGRVEPGCEEYAARLRALAGDLPIHWLGELPDSTPLLRELDLFVMISNPAGCPNASLEALAAGLPVIATDVGGVSEQVIDGVTGRLVPSGDSRSMADALVALARDVQERQRLSQSARDHIGRNFSVEKMVNRYRRVCLGE